MRLKKWRNTKNQTNQPSPAHPSGNFKSKLQFQGMNPINISFKIGFALFFFSKVQKSKGTVPTLPKVWQEKAFFGNGLNPKQSGCVSSAN